MDLILAGVALLPMDFRLKSQAGADLPDDLLPIASNQICAL